LAAPPEDLSPKVAELLAQVKAKVAVAPTLTEIRDLADRALAEARANALTVSEIGQLADLATRKAREVEACAARLAELLSGVTDGE
jgi:uncharacterized protein YpuA (DUF1002 family)